MKSQTVPLKYVDLHVHTTCSDGTLSPEEVVEKAFNEGIGVLAITDHDNVSGIASAQEAAKKYGIKIIPGIECSTACETGNLHILGYNIDPDNSEIKNFAHRCQAFRLERIVKILHKLNELGMNISLDTVMKISDNGTIGRPHIARAMLEKGYVSSIKEAFEKYMGKGKIAYVPKFHASIEEVIYTIKAADGIPVLAHPLQMNCGSLDDTIAKIKELVAFGIEGVEIIYPEHEIEQNYAFNIFAYNNNLFVTCGSDFHGDNKVNQLGKCFFNAKKVSIEGLKKLGKTVF